MTLCMRKMATWFLVFFVVVVFFPWVTLLSLLLRCFFFHSFVFSLARSSGFQMGSSNHSWNSTLFLRRQFPWLRDLRPPSIPIYCTLRFMFETLCTTEELLYAFQQDECWDVKKSVISSDYFYLVLSMQTPNRQINFIENCAYLQTTARVWSYNSLLPTVKSFQVQIKSQS